MRVLLAVLAVVLAAGLGLMLLPRRRRSLRLGANRRSQATPGTPEAFFAVWFAQRKQRLEQRDIFVRFMRSIGLPETQIAESVVHCVTEAWKDKSHEQFGDALAAEIEGRTRPDDSGGDPASAPAHFNAGQELAQVTGRLRALDHD